MLITPKNPLGRHSGEGQNDAILANELSVIKNRQSGATLITALIMLIVLTLLVVSGIRASNINLRIAGNMQMQEEVIAAAQQSVEGVISTNFTTSPAPSSAVVNIGGANYTVNVAPSCTSSVPIPNNELNPANPADQPCFISGGGGDGAHIENASGVAAASSRGCARQTWDVRAQAINGNTGASATVYQGVFLRVPIITVCP